jgi:hypothetical protein
MFAPIACLRAGTSPERTAGSVPAKPNPQVRRVPWLAPEDPGQPPVTRPKLGLYTISTIFDVLFSRVRSHWGSRVTADTENNPLIGLPNQHIVGLTYVP